MMTATQGVAERAGRVHAPTPAPDVAIERDDRGWTEYVNAHGAGTGYHDWAWRRVFEGAFGHEPVYFTARRDGVVVGILPGVLLDSWLFGRALISLPFVNYGGVLADDRGSADALLSAATAFAASKRCKYVELRHTVQQFSELPCRRHKVAMVLKLQAPDAMWNGFDRKVRNQIRKAEKSGLTHEMGGAELIADFYAVFARNMRDLGTPVYGRAFFEQMLAAFPDRTRIHIVRSGSIAAAAGFTFRTRSTLEIPWASSVRDLNALCPNHLLYWTVLKSAALEGCGIFDFGRSTPDEGTYKFKEQWGAQPVPLCWEYGLASAADLPNASPANPKFRLAIAAWKKLPLGVATRVGPLIVRSIP